MRPIHTPSYVDYTDEVIVTVPGRYYSIAELLRRVVRNQPIPVLTNYPDGGHEYEKDGEDRIGKTDEVIKDMDLDASNPLNDPSFSFEDAGEFTKYADE